MNYKSILCFVAMYEDLIALSGSAIDLNHFATLGWKGGETAQSDCDRIEEGLYEGLQQVSQEEINKIHTQFLAFRNAIRAHGSSPWLIANGRENNKPYTEARDALAKSLNDLGKHFTKVD
ncbi:hypothetical protein [Candidatus Neptunochlamydia vexilliferae]|nr:hypothetical protein [Candidatus Neptunochlamydia vexilliferae]